MPVAHTTTITNAVKMHSAYSLLLSHHSDLGYEEGQCNFVVVLFCSELSTLIPGTKIPTNYI